MFGKANARSQDANGRSCCDSMLRSVIAAQHTLALAIVARRVSVTNARAHRIAIAAIGGTVLWPGAVAVGLGAFDTGAAIVIRGGGGVAAATVAVVSGGAAITVP